MLTKTPFALAPVRFVFRPLPAGTASHKMKKIKAEVDTTSTQNTVRAYLLNFSCNFTEFDFFVFSSTLLLIILSFFSF